jgi:hypothetical protein
MGLVACALVLAACGASSSTTATTSVPLVAAKVPPGWTSHNYGMVTISTPKNWAVQPVGSCVFGDGPISVLILGAQAGSCSQPPPSTSVTIENLPADQHYRRAPFAKPITVNGVTVYARAGPPGTIVWAAPALGVQLVGTGAGADKVLHTLGRPVWTFGKTHGNKTILEIGDGCLAGVQWFNAHTAETIPGSDSIIAASCTPAELTAALHSIHPASTSQDITALEKFIQGTLCAKYNYLKLCKPGS